MKSLILLILFAPFVLSAKSIKDYKPYKYDVRFTNPICAEYKYENPIQSRSGDMITAKPKNVYCKASDMDANIGRAGTPSEKILQWIADEKTEEIFMTYLSFSNSHVVSALCEAMNKRGVKVRLVLDSKTSLTKAQELEDCNAQLFTLSLRGHVRGLDYAHNKVFIVNPSSSTDEFKFAFGSGNMTSGVVLHHENWHFLTTNRATYLAQAHLCLMKAELDNFESAYQFQKALGICLAAINNLPEDDIQPFFVPGQGEEAFAAIERAMTWTSELKIAAHRFSYNKLIEALEEGLTKRDNLKVKLLVDDDLFWVSRPNTGYEKGKVKSLEKLGMQVRYMETNGGAHLLHHNKFIVFKESIKSDNARAALFTGAGNFTGTAFSRNWENFYFITIPEVVNKVEKQYDYMYGELATSEQDLPEDNIRP